jgi:hypothetical protein
MPAGHGLCQGHCCALHIQAMIERLLTTTNNRHSTQTEHLGVRAA